jgi:hypothetical protein
MFTASSDRTIIRWNMPHITPKQQSPVAGSDATCASCLMLAIADLISHAQVHEVFENEPQLADRA